MTIPELKKSLQNNELKDVYLFKGEETFLILNYIKRFKDLLVSDMPEFNLFEFEGETDLFTASETILAFPIMADKKLIIFKDSGILNKAEDSVKKMIEDIPDYDVVVFVESSSKKISKKLSGVIEKIGAVVDFPYQKPSDIRAWINIKLAKVEKRMSNNAVEHFMQLCEMSMGKMELELNKLIAYVGDRRDIEDKDIKEMIPPTMDYKIYELIDSLLNKRPRLAYEMLADFKMEDEAPTVILSSIFSQINFIAMVKNLRADSEKIDEFFPEKRKFLANRIVKEVNKYERDFLYNVMNSCAEYDFKIKSGGIGGWTAVELVMAEILKGVAR